MSNLYSLYFSNINQNYHIFKGHRTSNGICLLIDKVPVCGTKFIHVDISDYKFKCINKTGTKDLLIKYLDQGLDICQDCLYEITKEFEQ